MPYHGEQPWQLLHLKGENKKNEFVVYEKMIFVAVSKTGRVEFCLY
jgi:hypothetical protein